MSVRSLAMSVSRADRLFTINLSGKTRCLQAAVRLFASSYSYQNWMETHFNIQRRLYDYQFSLATTPVEFERLHQAFIHTYNTTAHYGLLQDQRDPPMPLAV